MNPAAPVMRTTECESSRGSVCDGEDCWLLLWPLRLSPDGGGCSLLSMMSSLLPLSSATATASAAVVRQTVKRRQASAASVVNSSTFFLRFDTIVLAIVIVWYAGDRIFYFACEGEGLSKYGI